MLQLEPKILFEYFHQITQIPRPSKKEEKIIKYLLEFGEKHQLETLKDEIGNVIVRKMRVRNTILTKTQFRPM